MSDDWIDAGDTATSGAEIGFFFTLTVISGAAPLLGLIGAGALLATHWDSRND